MRRAGYGIVWAAGCVIFAASNACATPAPIRHLVYNFGVTLSTTSTVHSSGIGGNEPASGMSDYRAGTTDRGQMSVDVLSAQPDNSLVVRISEHGRGTRSTAPVECVAGGAGGVICDMSQGGPNEEEFALLRLLGRNFFNPGAVDNRNHWQVAQRSSD